MATMFVHFDTLSLITWLFALTLLAATRVVSSKRLHLPLITLTGVLAAVSLGLNLSRCEFNDDTVFYLVEGFQSLGRGDGQLPMRSLPFGILAHAFALPSTILLATQGVLTALAGVMAATVYLATRRLGGSRPWAVFAFSLALLWGVSWCKLVLLRPDTYAMAFSLGGIFCLLPRRAELRELNQSQIVAGFMLLTLAASVGPRHWLYPIGGLLCLTLCYRDHFVRYASWALLGIVAGLLPTVLYITCFDSWTHVVQVTFLQNQVARSVNPSLTQPFPFVLVMLVLIHMLLGKHNTGTRSLFIMWVTAALNVLLLSKFLSATYPLLTWVGLSSVLIGRLLEQLLCPRSHPTFSRLMVALFAFLVIPTCKLGQDIPYPVQLKKQWIERDIAFALVDWLHQLGKSGCVVGVSPCVPINREVCWDQVNAHRYAYWAKPGDYPNGQGAFSFLSQRPAVIQWNPWPQASGSANLIEWAQQRAFLQPDQVQDLLSSLRRDYRLYLFPMPGALQKFGGGGFLVRRDLDATLSGTVKLDEYSF